MCECVGSEFCIRLGIDFSITARSVEDETRNAELNGNRNPEWWRDFSQLQIQIKQKSQFEFVPRDTSKFKSKESQFDFVP